VRAGASLGACCQKVEKEDDSMALRTDRAGVWIVPSHIWTRNACHHLVQSRQEASMEEQGAGS
jgi:hypothetical protein